MRELFALGPAELGQVLAGERSAGRSALLLSTCNRCELYWSGADDLEPSFVELARARGVALTTELVRLDGADAVRHLFTVVAGLDSQILGETEILGQVRRALDAAHAAGTTTREMETIFSAAIATGRRVRSATLLGRHPASVSSAAVDVAAREWTDGLGHRTVVVLGAGEAAGGVLRSLSTRGASNVALVNRHPARAAALAQACGATVYGWDRLADLLAAADLLFVATAAAHPVLSAAELAAAMADREQRRLVAVDLSVPRNVEPEARAVPGVRLFDLDDLQRLSCPAAGMPAAALREAERLLDEEIGWLGQVLRGHAAAPRLAELHRHGARIAEQEAAWALGQLGELSEHERMVVLEMANRLMRRVLYPVSRSLRDVEDEAAVARPPVALPPVTLSGAQGP